MDDWEREYEEDRKRLAAGKTIDNKDSGRDAKKTADPFYEPPAEAYQPPSIPAPAAPSSSSSKKDVAPRAFEAPAQTSKNESNKWSEPAPEKQSSASAQPKSQNDDEIYKLYSQYDTPGNNNRQAADVGHSAVNLPAKLPLPPIEFQSTFQPLFGPKFGNEVYFAEVVAVLVKGFFTPKETSVACIISSNALYLGNLMTGEILSTIDILNILEVHSFPGGAGIRTRDAVDLFVVMRMDVREAALKVMQAARSLEGEVMPILPQSAEEEKKYRKGAQVADLKAMKWYLCEDPRTGLRLAYVPEKFLSMYAPIAPKILHWFGGIYQVTVDWKGSSTKERRGAWLTATTFFISKSDGPKSDGKNIKRCVAYQFMTCILDGPDGTLGIQCSGGPPQPPLSVIFDTEEDKAKFISVIRTCFSFRFPTGKLIVNKVPNVNEVVRVQKDGGYTPYLFVMRTREELHSFMRRPTSEAVPANR